MARLVPLAASVCSPFLDARKLNFHALVVRVGRMRASVRADFPNSLSSSKSRVRVERTKFECERDTRGTQQ